MLTIRDIRRRIRSIGSTAQITRAMQMVAASKMRKAQQAAIAGRPFAQLLYRIQRKATTQAIDFHHPLLDSRPIKTQGIILVSADKGLCGALNSNLFRIASQYDPQKTLFITAGRKGAQFVARSGRNLIAEFNYSDTPRFAEARAIANFARDAFLSHEVDNIKIISTRFVNTLTQVAGVFDFLPIGKIESLKIDGAESDEELAAHSTRFTFEPDPETVLSYLLERSVSIYIYQVLLNAKASEQSARMVSMKNATDSANDLIHDLTLEYNKRRQAGITTELLDIAGGQANAN